MLAAFLVRFSALFSTTGATYLQTLAHCDPSTSPAVHKGKICRFAITLILQHLQCPVDERCRTLYFLDIAFALF